MSHVLRCPIILDHSPIRVTARRLDAAPVIPGVSPDEVPTNAGVSTNDSPNAARTDEALRRLLSAIQTAILDAEAARRQSLDELQQLAMELAVVIAGELVGMAVDADAVDVRHLADDALQQLGLDKPVTVTLHPRDADHLRALIESDAQHGSDAPLAIRSDPTVPPGHCRATNGARTLLSELGPRLETIRTALLEGLNDAQIERRGAAGLDTPLKRFPDRRDAAQRA